MKGFFSYEYVLSLKCTYNGTWGQYHCHVLQEYWQTTHTHICRCAPYLKSGDGLAPFTWVYRADNGRLRVSTNGRLKDTGQLWITVRHMTPGEKCNMCTEYYTRATVWSQLACAVMYVCNRLSHETRHIQARGRAACIFHKTPRNLMLYMCFISRPCNKNGRDYFYLHAWQLD